MGKDKNDLPIIKGRRENEVMIHHGTLFPDGGSIILEFKPETCMFARAKA